MMINCLLLIFEYYSVIAYMNESEASKVLIDGLWLTKRLPIENGG
jgi:hypothetical protein